jgi:S1-C subfamily serine protease
MAMRRALPWRLGRWVRPFALLVLGLALPQPAPAETAPRADVARAVVTVRSEVVADARTAPTLGRERLGSGVVIDDRGLVLTIGYLILEASGIELRSQAGIAVPGEIVGYDHETGFGLVRALEPLGVPPMPLGSSAATSIGDPLLVISNTGGLDGRQVELVDRREFAGYWEYLLDEALFTSPPHREFGGAALIDRGGRLVGIGSLFVPDAAGVGVSSPGNMFVPIDALQPIFADLLASGRRDGVARPWLGLSAREEEGRIRVINTARGGPAERAGIAAGDIVLSVAGRPVRSLAEFYKSIWAQGAAGATIPLRVRKRDRLVGIEVTSIDRERWLRWAQTF